MPKYYFSKKEATLGGVKAISAIAYELGWAVTDVFNDDTFMEREKFFDVVAFHIDPDYGQTMFFGLEELMTTTFDKVTLGFAVDFIVKNPYFALEAKKETPLVSKKEKAFSAIVGRNGIVKLSREIISLEELAKLEEICKTNL